MKTSGIENNFDEYSRKARLYPGLISAAPVIVVAPLFLPREPLLAIAGIAMSVGLTFLLANFVRSRGKRVEADLVLGWGGLPTTKKLRHRHPQNNVLFQRRRRALEELYGAALPTRDEEQATPHHADDTYMAAIRFLITQVRERRDEFPRVHEENISYGFARNLLGLKPIGIVVLLFAILGDGVFVLTRGLDASVVAVLVVHGMLLPFWVFFVKSAWVLQAGQTYAERLLETLDSPRLHNWVRRNRPGPPQSGRGSDGTIAATNEV